MILAPAPVAERPRTAGGARWLRLALIAATALMLLELLWELLLAPLRPGGSWLALKALPLALLLPGVARGALRPRQLLAFILLPLFAEGLVRALTEAGRRHRRASRQAPPRCAAFAPSDAPGAAPRAMRAQKP